MKGNDFMNLPNKLTIARMCAIPIVIIVTLLSFLSDIIKGINLQLLILLIVFILASITDFLDGKIARKYNLVTNFGKFMDPLADKLLVMSTMIATLELGIFQAFGINFGFVITIILARELAITGLRTLAADNGVVIAASKLGKLKTVSQMFMIIYVIGINMLNIQNTLIKDIFTHRPHKLAVDQGIRSLKFGCGLFKVYAKTGGCDTAADGKRGGNTVGVQDDTFQEERLPRGKRALNGALLLSNILLALLPLLQNLGAILKSLRHKRGNVPIMRGTKGIDVVTLAVQLFPGKGGKLLCIVKIILVIAGFGNL